MQKARTKVWLSHWRCVCQGESVGSVDAAEGAIEAEAAALRTSVFAVESVGMSRHASFLVSLVIGMAMYNVGTWYALMRPEKVCSHIRVAHSQAGGTHGGSMALSYARWKGQDATSLRSNRQRLNQVADKIDCDWRLVPFVYACTKAVRTVLGRMCDDVAWALQKVPCHACCPAHFFFSIGSRTQTGVECCCRYSPGYWNTYCRFGRGQ